MPGPEDPRVHVVRLPLTATATTSGGDARVRLVGELDMATASQLVSLVETLLRGGHRDVVLDLTGLTFVDAGGLAGLVAAHTLCRNEEADLTISGCRPLTQQLLALTGLSDLLTIR
ncbi:MAG: STAS domain-containing protein [Oryzihumus sp.]|jgi:anti-sigma B factor antagonist